MEEYSRELKLFENKMAAALVNSSKPA